MSSGQIKKTIANSVLEEDKGQQMNLIKGFLLITLFAPLLSSAQEKIEFDILFGNYRNDHNKKEFHLRERHWTLSHDTLIRINDHDNMRYTDTLLLKNSDIKSIVSFIEDKQLNKNINKDLKNGHLNKWGHEIKIRSSIILQDKSYKLDLVGNSTSVIMEDLDAQKMYKLEELLIEVMEGDK
ncbi:MAG: hypothetical protein ACI857_001958 [Arenicella sp.]|jgi:hypothetical protein